MNASILLAAGRSSRMGTLKALLKWGDKTLIEEQIHQIAAANVAKLVIVTGYNHNQLMPYIKEMKQRYKKQLQIKIVHNENFNQGKTSSIRLGVASLPDKRKFQATSIIGVDQPVRSETLMFLFNQLNTGEILIPSYQGKKGHPPVFSSIYTNALKNVTEENQGLRNIMRSYKEHVRVIDVAEPQVALNLNDINDYKTARVAKLDIYN